MCATQFGEPQATYNEADGGKTFEYSRQPEGQVAWMITIGADGKMSALRQVLKPTEFAKVKPGMDKADVRRLLGKPGKTARFDLKPDEEHWDWRWLDGQIAQSLQRHLRPRRQSHGQRGQPTIRARTESRN